MLSQFSFLSLLLVSMITLVSCKPSVDKPPYPKDDSETKTTKSGLKYQIVEEGKGDNPMPGDTVEVHYHGMLANDTVFDSSFNRKEPFSFTIGIGQVIPGWDEGIALLTPGAKAILTVPAKLGYGEREMGKIPPNSTLFFHVNLLKIKKFKNGQFKFDSTKFQTSPTGLKYQIIEEGKGAIAKDSQFVKFNFYGTYQDGKFFGSNQLDHRSISLQLGVDKGMPQLLEALGMFKVGSKVVLNIPPSKASGLTENTTNLNLSVEILDAYDGFKPYAYSQTGYSYTKSGFKYKIIEPGKGESPKPGDLAKMNFHCQLADGKVIQSSYNLHDPYEFPVGQGQIPGINEMAVLLKPGGKAVLELSYKQAFNTDSPQGMPPGKPVTFFIELLGE